MPAAIGSPGFDELALGGYTMSFQGVNNSGALFIVSPLNGSVLLTITPSVPGGSFGYAVSNVGDIDRDGWPELAVSSPYVTQLSGTSACGS